MKTYEAIVKGQNIPRPGIPESFKVLIKELQSLGLDVKVLDENEEEIDLKQNFDDDDDMGLTAVDDATLDEPSVMTSMDGFSLEDNPEEESDLFEEEDVFEEDDAIDFDALSDDIDE